MRSLTASSMASGAVLLLVAFVLAPACKPRTTVSQVRDDAGGGYNWIPDYETLSPSERIGREIWYKAASEGGRAHGYVTTQRMNIMMDFYRVLRADQRKERFDRWGLINDPTCCTPGRDCQQKGIQTNLTLSDTYGMDYCQGDEVVLSRRKSSEPVWFRHRT